MDAPATPGGKPDFAGLLASPGRVTAADVLYFRREVFRDGVVSRDEANAIFTINDSVPVKCEEWTDFFLESLTDYTVNQEEPRGYVTTEQADWLIQRVSHDGHIEVASEIELLVKILDRAKSSPESLVGYTLREIARTVIEGEGPLAKGQEFVKGVINEGEVELIRRVLYAFGGDSGISISKTEAEILFDLNEQTDHEQNHPAWRELFVKAVANYLMAVATDRPVSRAEAVVREAWLENNKADVGNALFGAVWGLGELLSKSFLDDMFDGAQEQIEKAWAARNARTEAAQAAAERIEDVEAEWLIEKLCADGVIDHNERGLLEFIKRESPDVHPSLEPLFDKVAAAS